MKSTARVPRGRLTWTAQVLHVARKDVRMSRWFMTAYISTVGIAVAAFLTDVWRVEYLWPVLACSVALLGILIVVHDDSPHRPLLWASLPLDATAVAAAKGSYVCMLVAIAVAGQTIALAAGYDPTAQQLVTLSGIAGTSFATTLATAAVVAGLTPNLRTFLLVELAVFSLSNYALSLAARVHDPVHMIAQRSSSSSAISMKVAIVFGTVLLFLHLYRARNRRRGILLLVLLLAGIPLLGSTLREIEQIPTTMDVRSQPLPEGVPQPALTITWSPRKTDLEHGFNLWAQLHEQPGNYAYLLNVMRAELRFPDGSVENVAAEEDLIRLSGMILPSIDGVAWKGYQLGSPGWPNFQFQLTAAQREAVITERAQLIVHGRITLVAPRTGVTHAVAKRRATARAGERVSIANISHGVEGVEMTLLRSNLAGNTRLATYPLDGSANPSGINLRHAFLPDAVLINRDRGEGVVLQRASSSGSTAGILLPIQDAWNTTTDYGFRRRPQDTRATVDEDWLAGSTLVTVDWQEIGSYPVSVQATKRGMARLR